MKPRTLVWGGLVALLALVALVVLIRLSPTRTRSPTAASATVRESLDVTIVESRTPQWDADEAWTLDPEPLLDLAESGNGPAHEFHRVADMLRTDDGVLVVSNGGTGQVRTYDREGRALRTFGGPGDGPGEFWSLGILSDRGAGHVTAFSLGRGTLLQLDTGLVRVVASPARPFRSPVPGPFTWGIGDPNLDAPPTTSRLHRPLLPIVKWDDDGFADTIAMVAGSESFVELIGDDVIDARPIMGKTTHVLATANGDLVVGTGEAIEYMRLDGSTGAVALIARVLGVDLIASEREVARERALRLGPSPSPLVRTMMDRLPSPASSQHTSGCSWTAGATSGPASSLDCSVATHARSGTCGTPTERGWGSWKHQSGSSCSESARRRRSASGATRTTWSTRKFYDCTGLAIDGLGDLHRTDGPRCGGC